MDADDSLAAAIGIIPTIAVLGATVDITKAAFHQSEGGQTKKSKKKKSRSLSDPDGWM